MNFLIFGGVLTWPGYLRGQVTYVARLLTKHVTMTEQSKTGCWPKILDLLRRRKESRRGDRS